MTMSRAYSNDSEGFCCCFWEAPSRQALEELFSGADVAFDSMVEVREFTRAG
jgi:hypothetical protein